MSIIFTAIYGSIFIHISSVSESKGVVVEVVLRGEEDYRQGDINRFIMCDVSVVIMDRNIC